MKKFKWFFGLLAVLAIVAGLSGCGDYNRSKTAKGAGQSVGREQKAVATAFSRLTRSQQVPSFDYSQVRQSLIDVETAQSQGALSTTQFYLEGIGLVAWCPSAGAPVASTSQLSPSKQFVDLPGDHTRELVEIDQGEPTGVYPGESSGTWTMCLDDNGKGFAQYWEGYVFSTIGITNGLDPAKRVQLDQVTFEFKTKKDAKKK